MLKAEGFVVLLCFLCYYFFFLFPLFSRLAPAIFIACRYLVVLGHRLAWWGSSKELDEGKKAKGQLLLQVKTLVLLRQRCDGRCDGGSDRRERNTCGKMPYVSFKKNALRWAL